MLITKALAASAVLAAGGDEWPDGPNKESWEPLHWESVLSPTHAANVIIDVSA
jgi:hypothetical protein